MKRDLDLTRQLLLEIESRGADCSLSSLHSGPDHHTQERIRHHLRLLVDAGLLKEVDRTSSGIPCVRLTHDGHELLELARGEQRWNEAKQICHQRLGGLSLTIIRDVLSQWADGVYRLPRPHVSRRIRYEPGPYVDRIDDYGRFLDDARHVLVQGNGAANDTVDLELKVPQPTDLI